MKPFDEAVPIVGFLTDHYIREALHNGYLIEPGTCEDALVRHASYMLRLGDTIHIARTSAQNSGTGSMFDIVHIGPDKPILVLQPSETALLYSIEYLRFPDSILGFTVARGLLFTHPLAPENTYVDPGYTGSLYTVVTNLSGRLVELKYGMPIARLFFYKLVEPVKSPYKSGAGFGVPQHLSTRPLLSQSSPEECQKANWTTLLAATRQLPITGNYVVEELCRRLHKQVATLFVAIILWPPILIIMNTNSWIKQNLDSITVNVIAGVIAAGVTFLFSRLWAKMKL